MREPQGKEGYAMATHKVLRVGVVKDEKIEREFTVPYGQGVTVGTDVSCEVVLPPADGAPKYHSLFFFDSGKGTYCLVVEDGMTGKIKEKKDGADEEILTTIETALADPAATHSGCARAIPLTDSSRGKVVIGKVTVLFQFVEPVASVDERRRPSEKQRLQDMPEKWMEAARMLIKLPGELGRVTDARTRMKKVEAVLEPLRANPELLDCVGIMVLLHSSFGGSDGCGCAAHNPAGSHDDEHAARPKAAASGG